MDESNTSEQSPQTDFIDEFVKYITLCEPPLAKSQTEHDFIASTYTPSNNDTSPTLTHDIMHVLEPEPNNYSNYILGSVPEEPPQQPLSASFNIFKSMEQNFQTNTSDDAFETVLTDWTDTLEKNYENAYEYSLEEDASFSNHKKEGDTILRYISQQCVSSDRLKQCSMLGKTKKLTSLMGYLVPKTHDMFDTPFLRLKLNPHVTDDDIQKILNLLCDCSVSCKMGNTDIFKLPKLLFSFLVCSKFNISLSIFDVEKFLEEHTFDEIKDMQSVFCEHGAIYKQKYVFGDSTDKYIDIPILQEFFTYGAQIPTIALQYHDIKYILTIPEHNLEPLSHFVDDIFLLFENSYTLTNETRLSMSRPPYDLVIMQSVTEYFHGFCENQVNISWFSASKFMFVIMRTHLDDVTDSTQYPQITNFVVTDNKTMFSKSIDLNNIFVEQFDDILVYGVALDCISDMKNWTNVMNEFTPINLDKLMDNKKNSITNEEQKLNAYTNENASNVNGMYGFIRDSSAHITFNETSTPVNMEVITIQQNMQRIIGGMVGTAFHS
jgi:hypothetical protein